MSEEMDRIIEKQMGLKEDKLKIMGYGTVKLYYHGTLMDSFSIELLESFHSSNEAQEEAIKFAKEYPQLQYNNKTYQYKGVVGTSKWEHRSVYEASVSYENIDNLIVNK